MGRRICLARGALCSVRDSAGLSIHKGSRIGRVLEDLQDGSHGVNSNLKLLISAISKVSRVGKFKLAHSSASLKFPRTSVPKTLSLLSCIYKPSYLLSASIAPAPCVFREAEGPAFTGFAARSWTTPARRFSRRR